MSTAQIPLSQATDSAVKATIELPRWGFAKGALLGVLIEIPTLCAALWIAARVVNHASFDYFRALRVVAIFAGPAAFFTAGGIGRVAAYASMRGRGGRMRSMLVAGATHTVASIGLMAIAAVATEQFAVPRLAQALILSIGACLGFFVGGAIGLVCGGASPLRARHLVHLAKRPTEAVLDWLSPDDIVRQGKRVAGAATHAASNIVDGLFDPAPERPPSTSMDFAAAPPQTSETAPGTRRSAPQTAAPAPLTEDEPT